VARDRLKSMGKGPSHLATLELGGDSDHRPVDHSRSFTRFERL
jgi:hypothetical protein